MMSVRGHFHLFSVVFAQVDVFYYQSVYMQMIFSVEQNQLINFH